MSESTLREGPESLNENNKVPKKTMASATFLQQFAKEYVDKEPNAVKNELIEEVMTKDTLTGTKALEALMKFRASDEKYSAINLAEIDIFMLQKQLAKGFVLLGKLRQDFETQILKNYDITPQLYESKLAPAIKGLSLENIQRYMNSEHQLAAFLKEKTGKVISEKVEFDMLVGVSQAQMQDRVRRMASAERKQVEAILKKLQNAGTPRDDEIRALVESSLFDGSQKVNFVNTFVPFLTLEKAKSIGLIDEAQVKTITHNYVTDLLESSGISGPNAEAIEKTLKPSDIQIATKDLVKNNPAAALKISQEIGFQNFVSDVESQNTQAREKTRALGPKTFEGLKVSLADLGASKCANVGLLKPGNIIKFTKRKSGSDENIDYIKIVDFDDEKSEFRYQNIGNETINLKSIGEPKTVRYEDFLTNLKTDAGTRFEAFASETITAKIKSGDIQSSELQTLEASDFDGEDQKTRRDEVKQKQQEILEKELRDFETEFAGKTDVEKKDANNLAALQSKKEALAKFRTTDLSLEEIAQYSNQQIFLDKIDELDPEGKSLGFSNQVSFYTGKGEKTQVYTIDNIDIEAGEIHFHNRAGHEKLSFDTFFHTFKKKDAKRVKRVSSESELVSSLGDKFEYKDGGISQKKAEHNGKVEDRPVKYMANEKNKLIQIESISGGYVRFQQGKIEDGEHGDDHEEDAHGKKDAHGKGHGHHKSNDKKYNLKIKGAQVEEWTLDEFQKYAVDEKFTPDWKLGQNLKITPQEHSNKMHGSLADRFFKGISLYEVIHGGKMVIEGITETLHHGSEGKSAHAALMMSSFLPGELKEDMRMKVEAAEGEEMDAALTKLGKVDSWIAVERIEKWLKNRDTPEYKIEAGMLFMIEKYGHLTAKKSGEGKRGLYQYRGKFLWYERLGGHKGDELYNKVKAEAEKDGQTFSEEKLVHKLLKEQCNEERHHYSGKHRRSRIHKEYENKWKSGIHDELEKGEKDAGAFRSSKTMVRESIGEATGGTTSNAFGWAKKVVSKGTGTLGDMMHVPSVLLISGACFDIDQATYTSVKGFWDGEGMPVIAFRMYGDTAKMKNFNETVLELSKEIQKAGYPDAKYAKIAGRAQKIFDATLSRTGKEEDRIKAASEFWYDYGEVLSRGLNFSLQGDNEFAATDTIIKRKRGENSVFQKYYYTVRGAVGEGNAFKDEFVDDWAGETGIFGLNPHDLILKHVTFDQGGGFRSKSIGPKVWQHFVDDIDATRNKILIPGEKDVNSTINRKAQEDYIAELLEEITGSFYEMAGLRTDYIYGLNKETSNIGREFNKWGLNLEERLGSISSVDILNGSKRSVFQQVAKNIISGNTGSGVDRSPEVLVTKVKRETAEKLNRQQYEEYV